MISDYELKRAYQQVANSQYGRIVFADILSMLGYFSNMPDKIKPELIAIANTVLSRLNIFDSQGILGYVDSIIQNAKPVKDIANNNKEEDEDEI